MTDKPIDEAEARRILENLARNGPPTAQVASIKVLREMDKDIEARERAFAGIAVLRGAAPRAIRSLTGLLSREDWPGSPFFDDGLEDRRSGGARETSEHTNTT